MKNNTVYTIFLFFSIFLMQEIKAQSLYIAYREDIVEDKHKIWGLTYVPSINDWRNEMNYYFHREIYFYYYKVFRVASLDYASSSLVPISSLAGITIKTPEQLEAELNGWTDAQRRVYFNNLDHLYIVELYPNTSQARVVKVRLNIREQ